MSLTNKVAIVTGASSGIGAAIAEKLTEDGAQVVIVGRNETNLKNVLDICEKRGLKPLTVVADVTKEDHNKKIINETINAFEKLDILINNAGIIEQASILDENTMDVYNKIYSTNLRSIVILINLASKHLIATKGNIVNISSAYGQLIASPQHMSYSVLKAGLDHLGRCVALDLAPHGVRINTVSPGPVKTNIFKTSGLESSTTDAFWDSLTKMTALKRLSEAEEVADLVAFLVTDKAKSITGETILCDNGIKLYGCN